jgi:polyferredoxin
MDSYWSPRSWCSFCPMGTAQRFLGGNRYQLKLNEEKCIKCHKCEKVCPMQLKISENETKPDCIKCGRCISACPKDALRFWLFASDFSNSQDGILFRRNKYSRFYTKIRSYHWRTYSHIFLKYKIKLEVKSWTERKPII